MRLLQSTTPTMNLLFLLLVEHLLKLSWHSSRTCLVTTAFSYESLLSSRRLRNPLSSSASPQSFSAWGVRSNNHHHRRRFLLSLSSSSSEEDDDVKTTNTKKSTTTTTGVYSRPSAAIERGSGFFIPGLEGPRVRWLVGGLLLVLCAINYWYNNEQQQLSTITTSNATPGNQFAETLAIVYSCLLFLQAAIETIKEQRTSSMLLLGGGGGATKKNAPANVRSTTSLWNQQWSSSSDFLSSSLSSAAAASAKEQVEWAAATYLSLTPATQIMLLERRRPKGSESKKDDDNDNDARIVYRLEQQKQQQQQQDGSNSKSDSSASAVRNGCQAAFETLSKSTSGRISLPLTHPAVCNLIVATEKAAKARTDTTTSSSTTTTRCVILQHILGLDDDNAMEYCWLVSSDQLLAAFTKQDLQWLGQLADYVMMPPRLGDGRRE